jgi:hypothetical protein
MKDERPSSNSKTHMYISEPEGRRDRASVLQRFVSLYVTVHGNTGTSVHLCLPLSREVDTLLKLAIGCCLVGMANR